ncbi:MAG: DUF5602 domain-containing protein [Bacteroidota bacterium]|nr:DUF5602 domain-containing protein [Bacteroidota bacterium]MDP4234186.1 DUF5602 domain-containing protein [Bacteroidota bacterium]MDP4243748.1 DUF5602 domain-containing protein [Bacteroidota bacterium]MDP4287887.1 DUF5602 domain-containing protein [Bacteroidota bacterium]
MKTVSFSLSILCLGILIGCSSSTTPQPQTYIGASTTIGSGTANSWVTVDGSGNMTAIGVTISDAALASLPAMGMMYEIPMPAGVTTIPYKSISLDYATMDPAPYNVPHLDAHFYFEDMMARMNIMQGIDTMMPGGMMLPAGYTRIGECDSMMGVHYMDTSAPEWHKQPFHCAFVYGFAKGTMTFMEAMCDQASLSNHTALSGTVKPMMMMSMPMSMPKTYKTSYDATTKTTKIELDGF